MLMFLFDILNLLLLLDLAFVVLFDSVLLQQPHSEVVDGVLWLLLVDLGEPLGNDQPNVVLHNVGRVRM